MCMAFFFVALLTYDIQELIDGSAPPLTNFLFNLTGIATLIFLIRHRYDEVIGLRRLFGVLSVALCSVSGTTSTPEIFAPYLLFLGTVLTLALVISD